MNIKKIVVCILLFMAAFYAAADGKWYAVNTKYIEARIDSFTEINSSVSDIIFSFKLSSSCEDLGFSSLPKEHDQYITANGSTDIWHKFCLTVGKNGSYVGFRANKNTSSALIKAFRDNKSVKLQINDYEILVPSIGFNDAYTLLRDE